mmetsp:Transcript_112966/g.364717  ORF Transcript_112966/g.364717 Transcript_112966/m.364717 type:complete len:245 (+) Transcript_112966:386-1120(+)
MKNSSLGMPSRRRTVLLRLPVLLASLRRLPPSPPLCCPPPAQPSVALPPDMRTRALQDLATCGPGSWNSMSTVSPAHSVPRSCSFKLLRLSGSWPMPTRSEALRGSRAGLPPALATSSAAPQLPSSKTRGSRPSGGCPGATRAHATRTPSAALRKRKAGQASGRNWALRLTPRSGNCSEGSSDWSTWISGAAAPSTNLLHCKVFSMMGPVATSLAAGSNTKCFGAIRLIMVYRSFGSSVLSGRK